MKELFEFKGALFKIGILPQNNLVESIIGSCVVAFIVWVVIMNMGEAAGIKLDPTADEEASKKVFILFLTASALALLTLVLMIWFLLFSSEEEKYNAEEKFTSESSSAGSALGENIFVSVLAALIVWGAVVLIGVVSGINLDARSEKGEKKVRLLFYTASALSALTLVLMIWYFVTSYYKDLEKEKDKIA